MCFGRVPPEVNSGRMFNGAGSGSMVQAAEAWEQLAGRLRETSAHCREIAVQLSQGWRGTVAVAVTYTMAEYLGWLDIVADQAARAAAQARIAVDAHASVIEALVSPNAININRLRLVVLAATNYLGQASAAIADTEAEYEQMWVTDSAAMYAYARASADASALVPVPSPLDAADFTMHQGGRDRRVSWALKSAPDVIAAARQVMETLPKVMRALSTSPQTTLDVDLLPATASLSFLSSLSPPSAVAVRNLNSLNKTAMLFSALMSTGTRNRKTSDEGPFPLGPGVGTSIGTLSVPRRWVSRTTPAPDAVDLPSDWVPGPIRLVYADATQRVGHDDRSERSGAIHGE
jgi:hypothetical protein